MTANKLIANDCVLVLVDYQEKMIPAIHDGEKVARHGWVLARAAHTLGVPVIGTAQNPKSLGENLEQIRSHCHLTLAKTHFDACSDGLVQTLHDIKPDCRNVVIAGCESHVCMMQTALGLLGAGKRAWVVSNASGSRRPLDHATAMTRLEQAGAIIVTYEMVLFEWLEDCKHPHFKEVLQLVKDAF